MARKSPEESGAEPRAKRGSSGPFEGFSEGEHGRGPTPYKRSHSSKPNGYSLGAHEATAGRGGPGVFGGSDGTKGHVQDYEHPQSHAEFENLGVK